jgi:aarF domain-containing kinase
MSTSGPINAKRAGYKKYFTYGIAVGLIGTGLFATSDTARHFMLTYERVGVVTVATIRCFMLYKDTLGHTYESPEEKTKALSDTHKRAAEITLKAIRKNGGIYIKLGQHISALTYLLPIEWTDTMIPLQDRCPRSSMEEISELFKTDLGKTLDEVFSEFDPNPIGVASLAQVHVAVLKDTAEKVAVKIQHPALQEFVPLDVYVTQTVFQLMYKFFPEYPLTWLGDEMQNSIYVELDFTNEAENAMQTATKFKPLKRLTALRIPKVVHAEKRILIMEHIAGARLDDIEYLEKHNISKSEVASCLSHIFNCMIFKPGFSVHCDPHGGNLAIRHIDKNKSTNGFNFEIVLYDHGLYRTLPLQMKRDYSHFWLAVLDNDIPNMKKYAEKFAGITGDQKFQIFAAAITGRAPEEALNYDINTTRTDEEIAIIQSRLNSEQGILEDLMEILSSMPRLVLLILKTNDLTRNLDENLKNPLGQVRTFLIMANYCARTIYDEQIEEINDQYDLYSFKGMVQKWKYWWAFQKRLSELYVYDFILMIKSIFRLKQYQ